MPNPRARLPSNPHRLSGSYAAASLPPSSIIVIECESTTAARHQQVEQIEHRLFSFISQNWRAQPLVSYRVIVELILATTTKTGLTVRCELDTAPSTCQVGLAGCRRLAVGIGGLLPIDATDFGPDPEFLGPGSSMLCGSDVIAAEVEELGSGKIRRRIVPRRQGLQSTTSHR